ncbi:MAG: phenylalanine--tRNA ligase subunit beta [Phycisphaerales bacterium]
MLASSRWINDYLDQPLSAKEQAEQLTMAGFPVEHTQAVTWSDGSSDTQLDAELTSNRGDCLCHIGLSRELAARTGRRLVVPSGNVYAVKASAAERIAVDNQAYDACPLYTARIIRNVKVAPSPAWLADRLRAIGQIPRNNLVDASNFILFEFGQPTHIFDLSHIRGGRIIIRKALRDEPFLPIGEGEAAIKLHAEDIVIADRERAVAIGGVKGGAETAVNATTTDILIEAATFDAVTVRASGRRHAITSASSYRYERGVDAAHIEAAAKRLVQLIIEVAGGELLDGVLADGKPLAQPAQVSMRPDRCRALLGVDVADDVMLNALSTLDFNPAMNAKRDSITCTIPTHRLDIEREADLIEEVSRVYGHDRIPVRETIAVQLVSRQPVEERRQQVANQLAAMGFLETVTHSLITERDAAAFVEPQATLLRIDDARAGAESILRPSIIPNLLRVRALNQDRGCGDVNLFEIAATFDEQNGTHRETQRLALLTDMADPSLGLRPLRGVLERILEHGQTAEGAAVAFSPHEVHWAQPGTSASISRDKAQIGNIGVVHADILQAFGLDHPIIAAELELEAVTGRDDDDVDNTREQSATAPPAFPAIERDLSLILNESVAWQRVTDTITHCTPVDLEHVAFVTAFRGTQIGSGRKSVTARLRFRSSDRTLTHDEVDAEIKRIVSALEQSLAAEIRT